MLCCLFLVILHLSAIRNLLSDLSLSEFPLVRRVKATYSILKSLLLEAKKRHLKHASSPNSSTESWYRVQCSVPVNFEVKFISTAHAASFGVLVYWRVNRSKVAWLHSLIVGLAWLVIREFCLRQGKNTLTYVKRVLTSAEVLIFFQRKFHHCSWRSNHNLIYHRQSILWLRGLIKSVGRPKWKDEVAKMILRAISIVCLAYFATVCCFTFCFLFLSFPPAIDLISAAFSSSVYVPPREKAKHVSGKACLWRKFII